MGPLENPVILFALVCSEGLLRCADSFFAPWAKASAKVWAKRPTQLSIFEESSNRHAFLSKHNKLVLLLSIFKTLKVLILMNIDKPAAAAVSPPSYTHWYARCASFSKRHTSAVTGA